MPAGRSFLRRMYSLGMEMKLLQLVAEYVNYETDVATLASFGQKPDRTREQIATEYGQALKQFLASD